MSKVTPEYAASFVVETFRLARDTEWTALQRLREHCAPRADIDNAWDRYFAASACVDALREYADLVA